MATQLEDISAAKRVKALFAEIGGCVKEMKELMVAEENLQLEGATSETGEGLEQKLVEVLNQCSEVENDVTRHEIKAVFLGSSSAGKHTVINAMLGNAILPRRSAGASNYYVSISGCGEELEGLNSNCGYVVCDKSDIRLDFHNAAKLRHVISRESMFCRDLIEIFWRNRKCDLLKNDVVIVDAADTDVCSDVDRLMDTCSNADVVVLVANAESFKAEDEKTLLRKVMERWESNKELSKPHVFVINNSCGVSKKCVEDDGQTRLEQETSFFVDELQIVSQEQASNRIFFVAAEQVLDAKLRNEYENDSLQSSTSAAPGSNFQGYLSEFVRFEDEFKKCVIESVSKSKLYCHILRAGKIIGELSEHAKRLNVSVTEIITEDEKSRNVMWRRLNNINENLQRITKETKEQIGFVMTEVDKEVSVALTDQVGQLTDIVREFDYPFHHHPMILKIYKVKLFRHVQQVLEYKLNERCIPVLQRRMDRYRLDVSKNIDPLLDPPLDSESADEPGASNPGTSADAETTSTEKELYDTSQPVILDLLYDIKCESLCADFQEDIEFKFSLGICELIERFIGPKESRRIRLGGITNDPHYVLPVKKAVHPALPANHEGVHTQPQPILLEDVLYELGAGYFRFIESNSTVLTVTVGMLPFLFWKAYRWQGVIFTSMGYTAFYVYEWLTWTPQAKERALKRQFVEHAADKLNLIANFTGTSCARQVEKTLCDMYNHSTDVAAIDRMRGELSRRGNAFNERAGRMKTTQSGLVALCGKVGRVATDIANLTKLYVVPMPLYNGASSSSRQPIIDSGLR